MSLKKNVSDVTDLIFPEILILIGIEETMQLINKKEFHVIKENVCIELMKIDTNTRVSERVVNLLRPIGLKIDPFIILSIGEVEISIIEEIDIQCLLKVAGLIMISGIMVIEKLLGEKKEVFGKMENGYL